MRAVLILISGALLWTGCPPFSCWWVPLELARRDINNVDASATYLVQVDFVDADGGVIDGGADCEPICRVKPCKMLLDDAGMRWAECQEPQGPWCD